MNKKHPTVLDGFINMYRDLWKWMKWYLVLCLLGASIMTILPLFGLLVGDTGYVNSVPEARSRPVE